MWQEISNQREARFSLRCYPGVTMAAHECDPLQQAQRLHITLEGDSSAQRVNLKVESYADGIGWYAAGSISFPIHQLPLLEQAIADISRQSDSASGPAEIIPFPGLRSVQPD